MCKLHTRQKKQDTKKYVASMYTREAPITKYLKMPSHNKTVMVTVMMVG
jgi:hypothetical protein